MEYVYTCLHSIQSGIDLLTFDAHNIITKSYIETIKFNVFHEQKHQENDLSEQHANNSFLKISS